MGFNSGFKGLTLLGSHKGLMTTLQGRNM